MHLSKLHQAHVMDVLLCLQEASGGPLVAQMNQVKALRWYVRASGIPFPDLYGSLFLSVMQSPDGERREAIPLPLAAVVALEKLVLSADVPTPDRLIAAAFLTCVWAAYAFRIASMCFGAVCFWIPRPCVGSHIAQKPRDGVSLLFVWAADSFLGRILPTPGELPPFSTFWRSVVGLCACACRL